LASVLTMSFGHLCGLDENVALLDRCGEVAGVYRKAPPAD
jgi:hypothetical protein